jgi:hypothetical protein
MTEPKAELLPHIWKSVSLISDECIYCGIFATLGDGLSLDAQHCPKRPTPTPATVDLEKLANDCFHRVKSDIATLPWSTPHETITAFLTRAYEMGKASQSSKGLQDCDEGAHGTHSPHCRVCKLKEAAEVLMKVRGFMDHHDDCPRFINPDTLLPNKSKEHPCNCKYEKVITTIDALLKGEG